MVAVVLFFWRRARASCMPQSMCCVLSRSMGGHSAFVMMCCALVSLVSDSAQSTTRAKIQIPDTLSREARCNHENNHEKSRLLLYYCPSLRSKSQLLTRILEFHQIVMSFGFENSLPVLSSISANTSGRMASAQVTKRIMNHKVWVNFEPSHVRLQHHLAR